ncbi:MAG: cell wall hydrolase [Desulfitobacteriaceae bacterium]|nr:cell wall hydrolase [Desulfitobacteriaceae bacterium]MDI6879579.1 cell wall hydrolase [Desulfitobacteriaceae bacterium]MDI6913236.1 cell wall hydrolase [Desulfitobacteriaceae bacterium]
MPHRRCRKSSAVFLSVLMTLFLWQGSIYPVQGHGSGTQGSGSQVVSATTGERSNLLRVVIQSGDTVWGLAERYGTTVEELVQLNRMKKPELILAGQGLWVNKVANQLKDQGVQSANQGGISQDTLLATRLGKDDQTDVLSHSPGKTLAYANLNVASRGEHLGISAVDLELLARVIYAEARGEDFEGQVAVGAVVLNRIRDPQFPKSIREVIYQQGAFTAVMDRQIHLEPDNQAYKAALVALEGEDPTGGAVYYYNPRLATDRWIKSRPVIKRIGNHTFSI